MLAIPVFVFGQSHSNVQRSRYWIAVGQAKFVENRVNITSLAYSNTLVAPLEVHPQAMFQLPEVTNFKALFQMLPELVDVRHILANHKYVIHVDNDDHQPISLFLQVDARVPL